MVFLRCMRSILVLLLRQSPGREGEAADIAQEGGHETQGMSNVNLRWEQRQLFHGTRRGRER